jgi:hypothetical protein
MTETRQATAIAEAVAVAVAVGVAPQRSDDEQRQAVRARRWSPTYQADRRPFRRFP